jgi:hypothetical protein
MELLLPLLCGGRVVLASREQIADATELILLLREQKISVMQATPTTWRLLLEAQWKGSADLKVLCGGEPWAEDLADLLLARCRSLWNMYGPTETTVWSAVRRIDPGDRVLIGRPIANTQFYVLGPHGEPEATDMPGELHIGGAGLARGYRGRPDLTAEKFVANRFGGPAQDRLYKTGDRVRRVPNGDIAGSDCGRVVGLIGAAAHITVTSEKAHQRGSSSSALIRKTCASMSCGRMTRPPTEAASNRPERGRWEYREGDSFSGTIRLLVTRLKCYPPIEGEQNGSEKSRRPLTCHLPCGRWSPCRGSGRRSAELAPRMAGSSVLAL